ncbi:hypothetical protein MTO96_044568, partial [Rhipicephalus appendiculatus]
KRRQNPHLQFFEKRLQHKQGARNRDTELEKEGMGLEKEHLAVEDRRIALEQDWLSLEREVLLQRELEWEEAQEEKRDEHYQRHRKRQQEKELYLRQQDALIDLVKSVVDSINIK